MAGTVAKTPASAIFFALQGTWRLKRSLNSALPAFPSGIFEGTAHFTPRQPTAPSATAELLYSETGQLQTGTGLALRASRQYIYRYDADEDKISAWFVKEETKHTNGREEVDYLFHDLEMDLAGNGVWTGKGEHLCEMDMYWSMYEFRLPPQGQSGMNGAGGGGDRMQLFGVRYKVKGPQKDYNSDTAYERVME